MLQGRLPLYVGADVAGLGKSTVVDFPIGAGQQVHLRGRDARVTSNGKSLDLWHSGVQSSHLG